jgi:WD40 repeat protein
MPAEVRHLNIGEVIQNLYEVTDFLGEGGFGKVYKVRHRRWNLDLAVKSPKPSVVSDAKSIEDFEREAETWANLGLHPHVVSCYYVRRIENSPLVFAEYVAGGSLHDWIRQRKLYEGGHAISLQRILDIAIQFAWGLHYAHEQGFVHQDVKPGNVMLTPGGIAKVTDFGLANSRTMTAMLTAQLKAGGITTLMVEGSGAMTPAYCSLEQANRETLTRRTDLWSWALSILEMFQGEVTWVTGVVANYTLEQYLQDGPPNSYLPKMPNQLASLLRHCFQENPDDRPHNMQEVASELQRIYQQVVGLAYSRQEPEASKDIADSLNNKAVSLLDLGKQDKALQLWQQSLKIQPQHRDSTYNQGMFLWRSGKITDKSLVSNLNEIKQSYPSDKTVDQLLGWVYLESDDCQTAINTFLKIKEANVHKEEVQAALKNAQDRLPSSIQLLRTFENQTSGINALCLSTNNHLALTGTWKNNLQLWDLETGKCLRTFEGHLDQVNSVFLSSDDQLALSGSDDKTAKLWEVDTGRCLGTYKGHTGEVNSVCLSVDSQLALSAGRDNEIKLWEIETGRCLRIFEGHQSEVNSICLSHDGKFAISGSRDKTIKLWSIDSGECLHTFEGHQETVNSACMSADNQYILSGSDDKTLKLWSISTGQCLRTFAETTSGIYSVCWSKDHQFALSGSRDNTVKLWEVATGRCLRTLQGHTSLVTSVCLSTDAQFALSAEIENKPIRLWAINGFTTRYEAPMMLSQVMETETALSFNQVYEQELAKAKAALLRVDYGVAAQHIRQARSYPGYGRSQEAFDLWNHLYIHLCRKTLIGSWESVTLTGHSSKISTLCPSKDGRFILSGSSDRTLKLWEIETKQCIRVFSGHKGDVTSISLSADGRYTISAGGEDRNLKLWDVESGNCIQTFQGYSDNIKSFVMYEGEGISITSVCLSLDDRLAFSGCNNKTIAIWEIPTTQLNFLQKDLKNWELNKGKMLMLLKGHRDEVTSICLSTDEQFIFSGSTDNTVKLWEIATGKCLYTFEGHTGGVSSLCLSIDNNFCLSGSSDGTLKLWDIATKLCIRTFEGHTNRVTAVSLSVDGLYALSGSNDKTMKLWELFTGQCLRTFEGYAEAVTSVSLTLDGRYAISGSNDGTLKLWSLDWELEDRSPADWDEGARPYLKAFLIQHTPYLKKLFKTSLLKRSGTPTWSESDFQGLLYTLGCAGYGWLRHEGVRQQLESMTTDQENLVASDDNLRKPEQLSQQVKAMMTNQGNLALPTEMSVADLHSPKQSQLQNSRKPPILRKRYLFLLYAFFSGILAVMVISYFLHLSLLYILIILGITLLILGMALLIRLLDL